MFGLVGGGVGVLVGRWKLVYELYWLNYWFFTISCVSDSLCTWLALCLDGCIGKTFGGYACEVLSCKRPRQRLSETQHIRGTKNAPNTRKPTIVC